MEQKFKRGYRVEILSRCRNLLDGQKIRWQNCSVGCEAIIQNSIYDEPGSQWKNYDYTKYDENAILYRLLVIDENGKLHSLHWLVFLTDRKCRP